MLKLILNLFLTSLVVFSAGACMSDRYVRYVVYKPVYEEGDRLVASEEPMSAEFRQNIKRVFEYYHVPYIENSSGAILIPQDIWSDRDTVWNYTTKANDPDWSGN